MNSANKTIALIGGIALLGLFLFPSWYETNGQYVKQLGHHFLFSKPEPVPVECYLVGCVTAPASFFHVVLDRRPWFETLSTVAVVASILVLLFRRRADGTSFSIRQPKTRWVFSGLVALALPVSVTPMVLVGIYGMSVPQYLFSGEDNSLWYGIAFPVIFSVYVVAVYLLSTVAVRISARGDRGPHSPS
jgi:uncharacterized membrane protein